MIVEMVHAEKKLWGKRSGRAEAARRKQAILSRLDLLTLTFSAPPSTISLIATLFLIFHLTVFHSPESQCWLQIQVTTKSATGVLRH